MTEPQTAAGKQEAEDKPQKSVESRELDAEIVRDLEADDVAGEARGGGCASSLTKRGCLGE